ncbi:MAG: pyruvate kinase [Acidobacteria bacterium]|nr:pyruvate kinase [Acidobacteriota bacterium]
MTRVSDADVAGYRTLIARLTKLRSRLQKLERGFVKPLERIHPSYRASARNLVHYIALRRHDIRRMQRRLSAAGISSLGNSEAAVLANLNAVIGVLRSLAGSNGSGPGRDGDYRPPVEFDESREILRRHARALLGREPRKRSTRIMVTLPTEAATDRALVTELIRRGMDCARINCAHDTPGHWVKMARNVRRASKQLGMPCRIEMDLGGPKVRTGRIEPGPAVVKWRPVRDRLGRVVTPAIVLLRPRGLLPQVGASVPIAATLVLSRRFIARLEAGETIRFRDARNASRALVVTDHQGTWCLAEARSTAYVTNGTRLRVRRRGGKKGQEATLSGIPREEQGLLLRRGDLLTVTRKPGAGRPLQLDEAGQVAAPAAVACTLPRALAHARKGEAVWFDDGRIGGVIEEVRAGHVLVRITCAKDGGDRLRAGRGINLPDTRLDVGAMTRRDVLDLAVVAEHADIVGLSFVRSVDDVRRLQARLDRAGGRCRGLVLKVETRRAFELLPELILAAMSSPAIGIMIARGDLAVECGYERLAEVQEEVLWICEAAHVPVVWATQVLENAAKLGQPSRAEISDAAMSERAECVMLNKGPHILETVDLLDRILRRMGAHQHKKRAMLRRLHWWTRVQKRMEAWEGGRP